MTLTRRQYLTGLGVLAATGLAGCADATASTPTPSEPTLDAEPSFDGWFDGVGAYTGTVDRRGETSVSIVVGAKGGMGHYTFDQAAVAVSPGTTVTWTWTGNGGGHNVVADDGTFESPYTSTTGATFTHTFDAPGVYRYYCAPHKGMGMKGAVVVLE